MTRKQPERVRVKLYGIPNCDKVKRTLAWLAERSIEVDFHDYKKLGVDPALIKRWLAQVDWPELVNRAGTTWRKLPDDVKAAIDSASAATKLMIEQPSVIKRPIIEHDGMFVIGFDPQRFDRLFS